MDTYGSVIENEDIVNTKSGIPASGIVVLPDSEIEDSLDVESFGDVILPCEIRTHRKSKTPVSLGLSANEWADIRQRRADNNRKHGEETEFELTDAQKKIIERWDEIYEEEVLQDKAAFERRMKRNQQTYGKIG
jgi:hypothetical protein